MGMGVGNYSHVVVDHVNVALDKVQDDRSEIIDDNSVFLSFNSRYKRLHDRIKVTGLSLDEADGLTTALLGMYGKKLDQHQMSMLMQTKIGK